MTQKTIFTMLSVMVRACEYVTIEFLARESEKSAKSHLPLELTL